MTQKPEWWLQYDQVMIDPAASWWLKGCLDGAIQYRDPVDVLNDLDVLRNILTAWAGEVQEEFRNTPPSLLPGAHSAGRSHLPGLPGGL